MQRLGSLAGLEPVTRILWVQHLQLHICTYRINRDLIVNLDGPPDQYASAWYLVQRIGIHDGPVQALPRPNRLGELGTTICLRFSVCICPMVNTISAVGDTTY
jgi:hypothetical protein